MEIFNFQQPYNDPQFESLFERIYPARVCVDNNTCQHCTVVKVDSANKHGVLLEIVQFLSDLDLVISKSYICSDGGWFMDVFHVTDQGGNKITDKSVILHIQQALCATRRKPEDTSLPCPGSYVRPSRIPAKGTAIEITVADRPGLLSEFSAVLAVLGCHVTRVIAWTHNSRAACIIYVENAKGGPITDMPHLMNIQEHLRNVVKAHHHRKEKWSVRLITSASGEMHTERRLHQLMLGDVEYETCGNCGGSLGGDLDELRYSPHGKNCFCTLVSVKNCEEKGYSVVYVRSRDRPKLVFDTVCALTDMDYAVFHATTRCKFSIAYQEYYIRHRDGNVLSTEDKRHKLVHCLIAAVERRAPQGLRLDVSARNRAGLLSDVTRVLRECGLTVSKAEVSIRGERATGTFYVKGASGQTECRPETVKTRMKETDATVQLFIESTEKSPPTNPTRSTTTSKIYEIPILFSIGCLIWSRLGSFSRSFIPLKLSSPFPG